MIAKVRGAAVICPQTGKRRNSAFQSCIWSFLALRGDKNATAWALLQLATVDWFQRGDLGRTVVLLQDSLSLSREIREKTHLSCTLFTLGQVARSQGDFERAQNCYEASLTLIRDIPTSEL